ncbi:hypothetical protein BpHYR1_014129 [Brachionus plicatilis]|uniref:Uncharacterized protein n=1 Tax=Brachionus plicatilis TaxID=10195 RepID=A0A3M7RZR2_BRAPC|nr:hypothetical protein BpHYR1_014129 [Brachionus plicatilis]
MFCDLVLIDWIIVSSRGIILLKMWHLEALNVVSKMKRSIFPKNFFEIKKINLFSKSSLHAF